MVKSIKMGSESDNDMSRKDLEELFREAASCLQRNNISFWVEYGALLGLIREGRLIPWDHDIDFGAWHDKVNERLIAKAFDADRFLVTRNPLSDVVRVHPRTGRIDRSVDISLYTKKGGHAIARTSHSTATTKKRVLTFLRNALTSQDFHPHANPFLNGIKYGTVRLLNRVASRLVSDSALSRLSAYVARLHASSRVPVIYAFPSRYFEELQRVELLGASVNVPRDVEGYLETAYGKDWRVPRKWMHWYEGATYVGDENIPPELRE